MPDICSNFTAFGGFHVIKLHDCVGLGYNIIIFLSDESAKHLLQYKVLGNVYIIICKQYLRVDESRKQRQKKKKYRAPNNHSRAL